MPQRLIRQGRKAERPDGGRGGAALLLILAATGSCTTLPGIGTAGAPVSIALPPSDEALRILADPVTPPLLTGEQALVANAALPLAASAGPAAPATLFGPSSAVARIRAADCLAQAIYYEARSEAEEGQRAVAQVVLNRVRHPAWPTSVCGVVYQGALRAGGGCQFTFTCDGSLAYRPYGEDWSRARRLASEALAGRVFAPVGLSTFYHANYVMPAWAPRLLKTAVIGAHLFYRLPGAGGAPAAFSSHYAGVEPIARPNPITVHYGRPSVPSEAVTAGAAAGSPPAAPPARLVPASIPTAAERAPLVELQVRPEYRNSGQWRDDAPAALTGR